MVYKRGYLEYGMERIGGRVACEVDVVGDGRGEERVWARWRKGGSNDEGRNGWWG